MQEKDYLRLINNPANTKIKKKINKIKTEAIKLGNILTKENKKRRTEEGEKEIKTIRDELCRLENTNLTRRQKERAYDYLIGLANALDREEKYRSSNYDDQVISELKTKSIYTTTLMITMNLFLQGVLSIIILKNMR